MKWANDFKNGSITVALKSFTWLVVEETTNASLRSVKEGRCHGVIFPICTEQLGQTKNKTETSWMTGFGLIVLSKPWMVSNRLFSFTFSRWSLLKVCVCVCLPAMGTPRCALTLKAGSRWRSRSWWMTLRPSLQPPAWPPWLANKGDAHSCDAQTQRDCWLQSELSPGDEVNVDGITKIISQVMRLFCWILQGYL